MWFITALFLVPYYANALVVIVSLLLICSQKKRTPITVCLKVFSPGIKRIDIFTCWPEGQRDKNENYFHFPNMAFESLQSEPWWRIWPERNATTTLTSERKKISKQKFLTVIPFLEDWSLNHHAVWHTL